MWKYPANPTEYKAYLKKPTVSFTVKKSIAKVSKIWKKQAEKCLNVRVKITHVDGGFFSDQVYYSDYRTKIRTSKNKIQLVFELKRSNQILLFMENPPADGFVYEMIGDAYSTGKNTTKVDLYLGDPDRYTIVTNAFKTWSSGKSRGCPDVTKL